MRLGIEFLLQIGLVGPVHARAGRITALRHEAGDHAVKHDAVVETLVRQLADAADMLGRQVGAQRDDDVAVVQRQGQRLKGIGHQSSFL